MKVRNQLIAFGELVKIFSTTTDIWSSRTMESFMAITLHAFTDDFNMINITLEVEPLQVKHN